MCFRWCPGCVCLSSFRTNAVVTYQPQNSSDLSSYQTLYNKVFKSHSLSKGRDFVCLNNIATELAYKNSKYEIDGLHSLQINLLVFS